MLGHFPSPVLSVAPDAVRDLEGEAAILDLWNVFAKCKDLLSEGQRLENISWRLWHREMLAHHTSSPVSSSATTPSSEKEMLLLMSPSPSPVSGSSDESSPRVGIGRMIFDQILPDKISFSLPRKFPSADSKVEILSPSPAPSNTVPAVQLPSTPPTVSYPKVVIVNPTPHPTPPATPLSSHHHHLSGQNSINPLDLQAPPIRSGYLAPPVRSSALTGIKPGEAPASLSLAKPQQAPSSSGALLHLRAAPKPIVDDTLKPVSGSISHPKFFLKESPELDDSSPDRETGVRKGIGGEDASSQADSSIAGKSVSSGMAASSLNSTKTSSLGSKVHVGQCKKAAVAVAAAPPRRKGSHQIAARPARPVNHRTNSRFGQKKVKSSMNVAGAIAPLAGPPNVAMTRTTSTRSEARASKAEKEADLSLKRLSAPAASLHLPSPPQPAPVRPALTRKVSERVKAAPSEQQRRGIVVDNSSTEYETTDYDDSDWASEDVTPAEDRARKRKAKKHAEAEKAKREEEDKKLREKDMFAKLPRRSYTHLPDGVSAVGGLSSQPGSRTRSVGLLSQLLNPDPTIFPPSHPYRTSFSTQDMTQFSRGGASGLTMTRVSIAVPLATPVTAHAPAQNGDAGANVNGKYRPRGRPEGAEMDDDSGEEDENKLELSTSLAQQRLAALADPDRRRRKPQEQDKSSQQQVSADYLPEQRAQPRRPALTTASTTPIPLSHPYNLPAPAPPSTPRTTRRQMLATELSESLRRNLLWERQISRVGDAGVSRRRNGGVLGAGLLKPLTSMNATSNTQAGASASSGRGEGTRSGDEAANKIVGEESKEERRKKALARNRSWADDFHYAGW